MPQKAYKGYCQSTFSSNDYNLLALMAPNENSKSWFYLQKYFT